VKIEIPELNTEQTTTRFLQISATYYKLHYHKPNYT